MGQRVILDRLRRDVPLTMHNELAVQVGEIMGEKIRRGWEREDALRMGERRCVEDGKERMR